MSAPLRAPFPYPGGKSRAAAAVWAALGDPAVYVEPFAGSLAVLLHRPDAPRVEVVNDLDGFVANFWRAVSADPEGVERAADHPVCETDLHTWHRWLVAQRAGLTAALDADPRHASRAAAPVPARRVEPEAPKPAAVVAVPEQRGLFG